jgi:hypothetical protein
MLIPFPERDDRQLFQIDPNTDLDPIADECSGILLDNIAQLKLCQHKNRMMQRITLDGYPYLKPMKIIHIRLMLSALVRFEKWDARRERYYAIDVPAKVASIILKYYYYYPKYVEPEGGTP